MSYFIGSLMFTIAWCSAKKDYTIWEALEVFIFWPMRVGEWVAKKEG